MSLMFPFYKKCILIVATWFVLGHIYLKTKICYHFWGLRNLSYTACNKIWFKKNYNNQSNVWLHYFSEYEKYGYKIILKIQP